MSRTNRDTAEHEGGPFLVSLLQADGTSGSVDLSLSGSVGDFYHIYAADCCSFRGPHVNKYEMPSW